MIITKQWRILKNQTPNDGVKDDENIQRQYRLQLNRILAVMRLLENIYRKIASFLSVLSVVISIYIRCGSIVTLIGLSYLN